RRSTSGGAKRAAPSARRADIESLHRSFPVTGRWTIGQRRGLAKRKTAGPQKKGPAVDCAARARHRRALSDSGRGTAAPLSKFPCLVHAAHAAAGTALAAAALLFLLLDLGDQSLGGEN